ncbi:MAG: membrane lipoprotein lipid attachment site-containing protein [Dehalococcoidia bacterium]|nr:membrane lipoprotein lipid attachment site-containing protein [Dehalococcoidia bacterium]
MKKITFALLCVLALTACAEITATQQFNAPVPPSTSSTQTTASQMSDIAKFQALPSTIQAGSSSMLEWEVNNATSVNIDHGVGPVPTRGTWQVSPVETTTYTLSATSKRGTCTSTAQVIVQGNIAEAIAASFNLPVVEVFKAEPANIGPEQTAVLSWEVTNSFDVEIRPGLTIIPPKGSVEVSPAFTTTYQLTTTNENGALIATTTLTVSGSPPDEETPVIEFFTATPYVIQQGSSCILSWQSVEGSSASIDNEVGIVGGSGTTQVSPTKTTTYMLTVTNPRGAQFQTVTVNVR